MSGAAADALESAPSTSPAMASQRAAAVERSPLCQRSIVAVDIAQFRFSSEGGRVRVTFVPRQRLAQSRSDVVRRLEPQQPGCLGNVGLRMADVTGTEIVVARRPYRETRMALS